MPAGDGRHERWLRWIPPLLMLAIACLQVILVHTIGLTPWKGGGFGMFSVIDQGPNRFLSGECLDQQGRPCLIDLAFPSAAEQDTQPAYYQRRFRARPYSRFGDRLADLLMASEYVRSEPPPFVQEVLQSRQGGTIALESRMELEKPPLLKIAEPRRGAPASGDHVSLKALRLRVWRTHFNASDGSLWCTPIGDPVERGEWR